ncbi:MAG: hypothetical protein GF383_16440, partial [Candidatus Lokiarchaeota archaeon]|nr:hypothetical protein [Candidatus Lokiarchaeota archaeon]MBD3343350.1 hypothetical protein [Candidatus Lokiarchaeota archaeon]
MVLAVIDSDVLIHLAKLNQLELLKTQFSQIFISETIYDETVVKGLSTGKKDAQHLNEFIKQDFIKIEKASIEKTIEIMNIYKIHRGESSIFNLAEKMKVDYFISNEIKLRNAIKTEGFKVVGTLGIILKAFTLHSIKKKKMFKYIKLYQNKLPR